MYDTDIWHVICLVIYVCGRINDIWHVIFSDLYRWYMTCNMFGCICMWSLCDIWHVSFSDLYRWYMTCNMFGYIYGGQVSEGGSHLLELVQQRTLSAHSYYFCFFFLLFPISYFLFLFSYFFFLISYLTDREQCLPTPTTASSPQYSYFLFIFYLLSFIFYLWCIFISLSNREQCLPTPTTASSSPFFSYFLFCTFFELGMQLNYLGLCPKREGVLRILYFVESTRMTFFNYHTFCI